MRKSLFGLLAASSVFALTAAGATGYTLELTQTGGSIPVPGAKSVTIDQQSKCRDALNISYMATNGVISAVTVNDSAALPSADCIALSNSTLVIHDDASQSTGDVFGDRVYSSGNHTLKWTFAITPNYNLGTATGAVSSEVTLSLS